MHIEKKQYNIAEGQYEKIKDRMLSWANQFSILLFLDSNNYTNKYSRYECLLAVGAAWQLDTDTTSDKLTALHQYHQEHSCWLFGHINYDYKNVLEPGLSSGHPDNIGFPVISLFRPEVVCYVNTEKTGITIEAEDPDAVYKEINDVPLSGISHSGSSVVFKSRVEKGQYLQNIEQLRQHIKDGDCYEINYCTEGFSEDISIKPLEVYQRLTELSPAPFAAYYRQSDRYMMCSSPERYLQKSGNIITAQPIKGTIKRSADKVEDEALKEQLLQSIKDRAENVMITDLMRNDLARSCEVGSVMVNELYGIYTFPQVHQMISTISGKVKEGVAFTDILRYSFPMGSMTGAPKIKVMELIEQYENSARGLFSGTVGYIDPNGDFDFNVIIRSLFYNAENRYLSYQTGGAITYDSSAEAEWEEMRLKAWALERVFSKY